VTNALSELDNVNWRDQIAAARAAGIIPRDIRSDEAALGIALKARELGVPMMAAYSSIHMIQGRPTCSAQLMLACARRVVGDKLKYEIHGDGDKCEGRMSTDGGETWNSVSFTMKQAQQAGLAGKDNWKKHPDDMLFARVASKLVRRCVPEATLGVYTPDEVEHIDPTPETQARTVEARLLGEEPPADPPSEPNVALDDWTLALEQCQNSDDWLDTCNQIRDDTRLSDADKQALKVVAAQKRSREGWTK